MKIKNGFVNIIIVVLIVVVASVMGYFALQAPESQTSKTNFTYPDAKKFLPSKAIFNKELRLDLEGDGVEEVSFSYAIPLNNENADFNTGVIILKYTDSNGWQIAFEDTDRVSNGGGPEGSVYIEKVKVYSSDGDGGLTGAGTNQIDRKEAVLVVLTEAGAGTATRWHLLSSINGKISKLDPSLIRQRVFTDLGYQDLGYNGVKSTGDFVIETQPGYSKDAPRCCPDKPSIEMSFVFTGNSIELHLIKKLEFNPHD